MMTLNPWDNIGLKAVNHISAMLAYWDRDEICRFANDAYLDWFGKAQDEMVDRMSLRELLGPLYEKNSPYIREVLRGNRQVFEREIVTPSGERRYSLATYSPDVERGNVLGFVAHVVDITPTKELEISITKSERLFKSLLESSPDATIIVNGAGEIELINQQMTNLFGYAKSEIIGRPVALLIPERMQTTHAQNIFKYFKSPKPRAMGEGMPLLGRKRNGEEFNIEVSLSPFQNENITQVIATIRDVSQRVESEKKLGKAHEDLEILTRRLTSQNFQLANFAHITSHNLRSPVNNLDALLHLYKSADTEEDRQLFFNKFEVVVIHLSSTLGSLSEALRIQESIGALEEISFEEILAKTREIVSAEIFHSGAIIESNFDEVSIQYNRAYMESIFLNLLTNAIRYAATGRAPRITFETRRVNQKVILTISDNGQGIDLQQNGHKLFGLHQTFHNHPDAKGVGLYLTKTQIESMGGRIEVESEVGRGTVFRIFF
jgi:PAS domain S-box-containing protein